MWPDHLKDSAKSRVGTLTSTAFQPAMLVLLFIVIKCLQLLFMAPGAEIGGDAAMKWDLSRSLAHGDFSLLNTEYVNHHYLRWGSWIASFLLISGFSDKMIFYYLSTAIPAIIAGSIFSFLVWRFAGPVAGFLFVLVFAFDPHMLRATFQLLPTGAALLPLSLLALCLVSQRYKARPLIEITLLFACCFWLYGVKETNLFFVPGVAIYILKQHGIRWVPYFLLMWPAGYAVETLAFLNLSTGVSGLGRIAELLEPGSAHFGRIKVTDTALPPFDLGIVSRWYSNGNHAHTVIYFLAIALFILAVALGLRKWNPKVLQGQITILSLVGLSFVFCTSFFLVSLDPVRMGQALKPRYIAILLPIAYIVIFYYSRRAVDAIHHRLQQNKTPPTQVRLIAYAGSILAVFVLLLTAREFSVQDRVRDSGYSVLDRSACYEHIAHQIAAHQCYVARGRSGKDFIHLPKFIPESTRGQQFQAFMEAKVAIKSKRYYKATSETCQSVLNLSAERAACGPSLPMR